MIILEMNTSKKTSYLVNFARPEIIFFITLMQIFAAYYFAMPEEGGVYRININYGGLYLWCFSYASFFFGCGVVYLLNKKDALKNINSRNIIDSANSINSKSLYNFLVVGAGLICASTFFIFIFYGGFPLLMVALNGVEQGDFNAMQADATPGLFGFHAMFIVFTEIVIGLIYIKTKLLGENFGKLPYLVSAIVVLATLIDGKRQGLVVFFIMILFCGLVVKLFRGNNINNGGGGNVLKYFALTMAVIFFVGVLYAVTDSRLSASGNQENNYSAWYEPIRYLCLPLVNIEYVFEKVGFDGLNFNFIKPLEFLLPAKLFDERGANYFLMPEPTSPLGFYASAWLWWGGVWGVVIYSIFIGMLCTKIYCRAFFDVKYIVLYGYVVWDLFAAHTYNHFMTINFFPLQAIVLMALGFLSKNSK